MRNKLKNIRVVETDPRVMREVKGLANVFCGIENYSAGFYEHVDYVKMEQFYQNQLNFRQTLFTQDKDEGILQLLTTPRIYTSKRGYDFDFQVGLVLIEAYAKHKGFDSINVDLTTFLDYKALQLREYSIQEHFVAYKDLEN